MKILMISRDPKVLEAGSAVALRIQEYRELFDDFEVVFVGGRFKALSFFAAFLRVARIAKKMGRGAWVTSQDPFEAGIIALISAKIFGFKLQLQLHTDIFAHFYPNVSLGNFFRMLVARITIPRADSLRVVSQKIKEHIVEKKILAWEKIFVLPIFVDTGSIIDRQFTYNLKTKYSEFEKVIIVVARLEKEKNVVLAIQAFRKMLRKSPKLGLVIIGDGSRRKDLEQLVSLQDMGNNVRFEGWATDVVSAYKSADLLLVTSFYEGYGMNIIEALACGCPVVSTDVGIAREAGAFIANYDPGEIALKCLNVLEGGVKGDLASSFARTTKQEYLKAFAQTFS